MGLGAVARRSAPVVERRAVGDLTLDQLLGEYSSPTASGVSVTSDTALRLGAVWGAVRLLADTVSGMPVHVESDGVRIDTPSLLVQPAAGQPVSEWLDQVMRCLLLGGNAVGVIVERGGAGLYPSQVELVHPDRCYPQPDGSWRVNGTPYRADQILHIRAFSLPGTVLGLSPIGYARETIGLGMAAERYGASFLGQGAVPTGILTSDNPDLDQIEADEISASWTAKQAARKVAVLNATTHYTPISIRPDEAQFLETIGANVAAIARVFGVPPELLAGNSGNSLTYANVESRGVDFLKFSVQPWITRLEVALSALLPAGQRVRLNPDGLLRTDTLTRYQAHESALRAGWSTVNEVRALENLRPVPDGDTLRPVPAGTSPTRALDGDELTERAASDLRAYWTTGAGLARWRGARQPLLALYGELLAHGVAAEMARGAALGWFEIVFGRSPAFNDGVIPT